MRETDLMGKQLLQHESLAQLPFDFTSIIQQLGEVLKDIGLSQATIAGIIQRASEVSG